MDRNHNTLVIFFHFVLSLSARRAWIEIPLRITFTPPHGVALRKESVDRNPSAIKLLAKQEDVALRKESVDRNVCHFSKLLCLYVALRKESVDRNRASPKMCHSGCPSLSARRAWIEIVVLRYSRLFRIGRSPQGERG